MYFKITLILLFTNILSFGYAQTTTSYKVITIGFYNLENLFDTINDPKTFDDDRTPDGKDHWTEAIYRKKLKNMASAIVAIGSDLTKSPPAILGVAEVENKKVLEDLIQQEAMASYRYGIIHHDSPDRRGIDVALLYRKDIFRPIQSMTRPVLLYDQKTGKRVYTRDQLVVTGYLENELLHIIVNHWPSRRGGEARSKYKRNKAARITRNIIDSLLFKDPYAKIITMGDFNDGPKNESIREVLNTSNTINTLSDSRQFNPFEEILSNGTGSLAWGDSWNLFDQVLLSKALMKTDYKTFQYYKAQVYAKKFLTTANGSYKGYPFRSFANGRFTGGYSDHFPVCVYLIKKK
ncbi:endonuclease/exonuclease/phosphatase family protein [Aquimarina intermedia]|uniref:Endonuclease/Exonuclease/phosphatase family protein n=1 Tax=Aquimarina intermedia TaxID=350814 RepID=A0A5S5CCP4_9FLAO|nr:endonuclease/exonuclease/phosphatase family protein [Aquimarina intermedia]TYP76929.1 Endonuclease/Exonuclease/phosphatase family protein [Aquimarina intermedia]